MAFVQDILRGPAARVAGRVAAALAAGVLAVRLLDAAPGSVAELAALVGRAWVAVLVRPLVVAIGLAAALHAARTRVRPDHWRDGRRLAAALAVVLAAELLGSMAVRPAGAAVGVVLDLTVGAVAALVAYLDRGRPTAVRRTAS